VISPRSPFGRALYVRRWTILGWATVLNVLIFSQYALFQSTLGNAAPGKVQQLVDQFRFFGEAVRVDTPGGFVTFKVMGILPLVLGTWAILFGAGATRGADEHGALEVVLSTPLSRRRFAVEMPLALGAAVGLVCMLTVPGIVAGMADAGTRVDIGGAILAMLDAGALVLMFGILAFLLAQLTSRAAAGGLAGAFMALSYIVDGAGRATTSAAGLRPLSLFYYYNRSLPLVPDRTIDPAALGVLVALAVLCAVAGIPCFARRDLARSLFADRRSLVTHRGTPPSAHALWTRGAGLLAWRRAAAMTAWWSLAFALYTGYFVSIARSSEHQFAQLLGNSAAVRDLFGGADIGTNDGFLSALVFGYTPLVLTIFTVFVASRWPNDLDAGRLELELSTPLSRTRAALARYAAVVVAIIAASCAVWLGIVVTAAFSGFAIDIGSVTLACVGMAPLCLVTGGIVFAGAGAVRPGALFGVVIAFLALSFLADVLQAALSLPSWTTSLSIFHLYGTPILHSLNWTGEGIMVLVATVLVAVGLRQFNTRDLDRGTVSQ
jgi:ABC-2 type transport system permease protein